VRRKTRITIEQVAAWGPCDDYSLSRIGQLFGRRKYFTLDQLKMIDIPASDKLWCLLHEEVIPAPQLHLLACEYAERSLLREREAGREPDPRSWAAIDTKRRWMRKEATDSELLAARDAAWAAAREAARDAAREAARAAAWEAAWAAARAAAWAAEIAWQLELAFDAARAAEGREG